MIHTALMVEEALAQFALINLHDRVVKQCAYNMRFNCKNDPDKLGFRGEIVKEYHFIKPITYKGKVFCWFKKKYFKNRRK